MYIKLDWIYNKHRKIITQWLRNFNKNWKPNKENVMKSNLLSWNLREK